MGRPLSGKPIMSGGYVLVVRRGHPRATKIGGYVFEHIVVMESIIGRHVKRNEAVHHKNHIKTDNRPENLELMTVSEHAKHHAQENPFAFVRCWKGRKRSRENRRNISKAKFKWWKENRPTHCKHGHAFSKTNTRVVNDPRGNYRTCRICGRLAYLRYIQKKKRRNGSNEDNG